MNKCNAKGLGRVLELVKFLDDFSSDGFVVEVRLGGIGKVVVGEDGHVLVREDEGVEGIEIPYSTRTVRVGPQSSDVPFSTKMEYPDDPLSHVTSVLLKGFTYVRVPSVPALDAFGYEFEKQGV